MEKNFAFATFKKWKKKFRSEKIRKIKIEMLKNILSLYLIILLRESNITRFSLTNEDSFY